MTLSSPISVSPAHNAGGISVLPGSLSVTLEQVEECFLRLVSICMSAHSPYGPVAAPHLVKPISPTSTPKDLRLCAGGSLGRTLKSSFPERHSLSSWRGKTMDKRGWVGRRIDSSMWNKSLLNPIFVNLSVKNSAAPGDMDVE